MTNKEIAINIIKILNSNNIDEIIEILKKSSNPKTAVSEISDKYNLRKTVVKEFINLSILDMAKKSKNVNHMLRVIYTSESGEKAFYKICKAKKLNLIKTSLFNQKDYERIYMNPYLIYEIIDNKYKHMLYEKRQKILDDVYFQAFKNI